MNCTRCDHRLKITHTYTASGQCKTQRAVCEGCRLVHTIKIQVVEANPGHGNGAAALAKRIRQATPDS